MVNFFWPLAFRTTLSRMMGWLTRQWSSTNHPPKPETSAATEDAVTRHARFLLYSTRRLFGELTNRTQSVVEKVLTLARTGFIMMQLRASNYDYSSHWETRAIDASPTSILILRYALSKTSIIHSCEAIFQTARDYTVEWTKLYNTIFVLETDTFSSFFCELLLKRRYAIGLSNRSVTSTKICSSDEFTIFKSIVK